MEALPALEARIGALTATLQQALERALQIAQQYSVQTDGGGMFNASIQAHGDVVGRDKVTINQFFYGNFAPLQHLYVPPDHVFQRVNVKHFAGRQWLQARLDAFLNDGAHRSGVCVLEGEAGVGKTAFMAHLVYQRGYLHVFGDRFEGDTHRLEAVRSLAAQVVARYHLDSYLSNGTISLELTSSTHFLERLLNTAAQSLGAGERLVIVADALDQAGTPPEGVNPFGLPAALPDGVFLLVSQRPVDVRLRVHAQAREYVPLRGDDEYNQADVRAYLSLVAHQPSIQQRLCAYNYTENDFVQVLADKSEGNWMYLYYVLAEIESSQRKPLRLDDLPQGLTRYYCDYWRGWRNGERGAGHHAWGALYAPALATLAAAQEPLTVSQLATFARLTGQLSELEWTLLRGAWRGFIQVQAGSQGGKSTDNDAEAASNDLYRFYHASLQRLFRGEATGATLSLQEREFIAELRQRSQAAHAHIVSHYREQCKGDWPQLASDLYARRHLVTHLAHVNPTQMYALVARSDAWAKAREQAEGSYAGYLTDLAQAWQWAERQAYWHIGRQIRCALIESSIHTLSDNLPTELPRLAVECGIWSPAQALDIIAQTSDENKRQQALCDVASRLPQALRAQALEVARAITHEYNRANALSGLAEHLPDDLKAQAVHDALAAARAITDASDRADALSGLSEHLPDDLKQQVLIALLHGELWQVQENLATLIGVWQSSGFSAMTQETWCEALHLCANRPRSELLESVS